MSCLSHQVEASGCPTGLWRTKTAFPYNASDADEN